MVDEQPESPIQEEVAKKGVAAEEIEQSNVDKEKFVGETPKKESTPADSSVLTSGEKLLGVFAYISFFFLLPLLMKPKSKFCQFHAKQGLVLTLGFVLLKWVLLFGFALQLFFYLTYFILAFTGIFFAAQGKIWKYPVIGDFAEKLDFE